MATKRRRAHLVNAVRGRIICKQDMNISYTQTIASIEPFGRPTTGLERSVCHQLERARVRARATPHQLRVVQTSKLTNL